MAATDQRSIFFAGHCWFRCDSCSGGAPSERRALGFSVLSQALGDVSLRFVRYLVFASLVLTVVSLNCGVDLVAAPSQLASEVPRPPPLDQARLRKAASLMGSDHYAEAAAIYEELLATQPENPLLVARLAQALSQQAQTEKDPAKVRELNQRARTQAEKADKLGSTDPLTPLILAAIRPDGTTIEASVGAYSIHLEVEKLIREGEKDFARRDFEKALANYQKAFELEPANLTAAVYAGDALFAARKYEPACDWFRKAVAIAPDAETPHRYLGDALHRLGQREEAFKEWIAALICEPYQRVTRQHFTASMRAAAESRGRMVPALPAVRSNMENNRVNLTVNPDDGALILGYFIAAMKWRREEFAQRFPDEKKSRRCLAEEIYAINAFLEMAASEDAQGQEEVKKLQSTIDQLVALKREGLLEAYVFLERADAELVTDYPAYRAKHRDQLQRYVWLYWCGFD